jgi:hypothetical protein
VCESNKPDCPGLLRHWASKSTPSPPWLHDANVVAVQGHWMKVFVRKMAWPVRASQEVSVVPRHGRCAVTAEQERVEGWKAGIQFGSAINFHRSDIPYP